MPRKLKSQTADRSPTYDAFISYSRRDEHFAAGLERALERYRIPTEFRSDRSRFDIFRDIEDAGVGELTAVLERALDDSEFLIVVCSPDARASDYVNREIAHFASRKAADRIIPILASGRPNSEVARSDAAQDQAFPEVLYEHFEEPLAADFRQRPDESRRARIERLREAKFQVIAKLLRTRKTEELVGRDRRRQGIVRWGLAALIAAIVGTGGWLYYDQIPKSGISGPVLSQADEGPRIRNRLEALRTALETEVPPRRDRDRLLVATWSLRNFGWDRFEYGGPSSESLAYIAEIISHFDIVALQELAGDDSEFEPTFQKLLDSLGRHWRAVLSGVTEGRAGDKERLGFVYDSRKLRVGQFTDEVVLPDELLERVGLERQLSRTPFMAGFHFGDRRIVFCTVHIYYGRSRGVEVARRRNEVRGTARYLANAQDGGRLWADTMILLGDFQVLEESGPSVQALREQGFTLALGLEALPTNHALTRPYDQIAIRWPEDDPTLQVIEGGVFNFFEHVYRKEEQRVYESEWRPRLESRRSRTLPEDKFYLQWRTSMMSDHLPKWILLQQPASD